MNSFLKFVLLAIVGLILVAIIIMLICEMVFSIKMPLWHPIRSENLSRIKRILDRNPKLVNKSMGSEGRPIPKAVELGNTQMLELLFKYSPDHDKSGVYLALNHAAYLNKCDIVKILLDNNVDINHICHGGTPLHRAVAGGSVEMTKFLIYHSADLNKEYQGKTPLDMAKDLFSNEPTGKRREILNMLNSNGVKSSGPIIEKERQIQCVHYFTHHSVTEWIHPCEVCGKPFEIGGLASMCEKCSLIIHPNCIPNSYL